MSITDCSTCLALARQATVIVNNQVTLAATLGAEYLPEDGSSASREVHEIAQRLQAHGHKEAGLVYGLAALLPASLTSEKGRALITQTRDEVRVALGLPILVTHPVPRATPGDDELSVA